MRVNSAPSPKLADFFVQNFVPDMHPRLKPQTIRAYQYRFDEYIEPKLGSHALADITQADIEKMLASLTERNLGRSVVHATKSLVRSILRHAASASLIPANPASDARMPRTSRPASPDFYTVDEIVAIADALPTRQRTMILLAAFAGLRKQEISALRWEDYEGPRLHIRRTYAASVGIITETKTDSSENTVPVIPALRDALDAWHQSSGTSSRWLFPRVSMDWITIGIIRDLGHRGLTWKGWHAFRRGLATNLHQLGVPDTTIQRILRHSSVLTTQNFYIKTTEKTAADALEKLSPSLQWGSKVKDGAS